MTQGNFFTGTNAGGNGLEVTDGSTTNFDVNKIILGTGLSISSSVGRTVTIQSSGGGSGSGTVNSGTQYQVAYYATTGDAVSGNAAFTFDPATAVTVNPANNPTTDFIVNTRNANNALQVDASTDLTSIKTEDSDTNTVLNPLTLKRTSSNNPAIGIGTGLAFETETADGNNEIGSIIESVTTRVTATEENFDMVFKNMISGTAASESMRLKTEYLFNTPTTPTGLSTVAAARARLSGYSGQTGGDALSEGYQDGGLLITENALVQRTYTDFTSYGDISNYFGGICLRADTDPLTTLGGSYWMSEETAKVSTLGTGVNPEAPEMKGAQVQITTSQITTLEADVGERYSAVIGNGGTQLVGATGVQITVPANETIILQIVGDLSAPDSYGGGGLGAGVLLVLGNCTLAAY